MKTFVPLLLLGVSAIALASPLEDCRAKEVVANGMRGEEVCFGEERNRLDKQVEKIIAEKVKRIPKEYEDLTADPKVIQRIQKSIRTAHRSWKQFRDDYCRSQYEGILGSGASLESLYCDIRLTEQYLNEIRSH